MANLTQDQIYERAAEVADYLDRKGLDNGEALQVLSLVEGTVVASIAAEIKRLHLDKAPPILLE